MNEKQTLLVANHGFELIDKWWAENKDGDFHIRDTVARAEFPWIEDLVYTLPGEPERIRLMRLVPNGGTLNRHTDLVDEDSGTGDTKIARFHFPLITNDKVIFKQWDHTGAELSANMKVGECWYLDTRKPHAACNGGDRERIHLVVDVHSNDSVRNMIRNADGEITKT